MSLFPRISGIFIVLVMLAGCNCTHKNQSAEATGKKDGDETKALPKAIIYKTTRDYSDQVAVIMDANKKSIVGYPAPSDIQGSQKKPTNLGDGYWLDNQGINKNAAFLSYTFEEYGALKEAPTLDTLKAHIMNKNPIVEMWNCGYLNQYHDLKKELAAKVADHFGACKRIK